MWEGVRRSDPILINMKNIDDRSKTKRAILELYKLACLLSVPDGIQTNDDDIEFLLQR